jgi:hypothetical protein
MFAFHSTLSFNDRIPANQRRAECEHSVIIPCTLSTIRKLSELSADANVMTFYLSDLSAAMIIILMHLQYDLSLLTNFQATALIINEEQASFSIKSSTICDSIKSLRH